jgi:hypothetical protein
MLISNAQDLFVPERSEIYDAEHSFVEAGQHIARERGYAAGEVGTRASGSS